MIDTSEFPADYKPRIMAGMAKDYLGKQVLLLGKVKEVCNDFCIIIARGFNCFPSLRLTRTGRMLK